MCFCFYVFFSVFLLFYTLPYFFIFFFKQKTAYEMRISDWSSYLCSSDLVLFHLNLNHITYFMRAAIFIIPPLVYIFVRRWCISLQRHDNEMLTHGYESGIIMRSAEGGYSERHLPLNEERAYTMTARDRDQVFTAGDGEDANGVAGGKGKLDGVKGRLATAFYADNVQKPTTEEIEEGRHHLAHDLDPEHAAGLDHPADDHQFDGRHELEGA